MASVDRHGDTVILSCSDADAALESLYRDVGGLRDVEVRGGSLEEVFMELTADELTADGLTADGLTADDTAPRATSTLEAAR